MAVIEGGGGPDALLGTGAGDRLVGRGGDDILNGLAGSDTLIGGAGEDILYGGAGDDRYRPGDNGDIDRLYMGRGNDVVDLSGHDASTGFTFHYLEYAFLTGPIEARLRGDVWRIQKPGGEVDRVVNVSNDTANFGVGVSGGHGDDKIVAKAPSGMFIELIGRGGDDTMVGGAGFDRIANYDYAPPVRVKVFKSDADGMYGRIRDGFGGVDRFRKIDEIRGSDHDDRFIGSGGAERFITDGGDDFVNGRGGFDMLNYDRSGLTSINADLARNRVIEHWSFGSDAGRGRFSDTVRNVEHIRGSDGEDVIRGRKGGQRLDGRDGDDLIIGRAGSDTLIGGQGEDTFRLQAGHGRDTIVGFEQGADVVSLKRGGGVRDFDDLNVSRDGGDTVVAYRNVTITFEDTPRRQIDESDFAFFG